MSTSYRIAAGDTFETISRNVYGDEFNAYLLKEANPGVSEPLVPGVTLAAPAEPDLRPRLPALNPTESGILIDGKRFGFWESVRIVRSIDAMDTIQFSTPFDADNQELRETFRPLSFRSCVFYTQGKPLFTGTAVTVDPVLEPNRSTLQVGGYSLPGVLNDCTAPASAAPFEWDGFTLDQIADRLIRPFGIGLLIRNDLGAPFERVACGPPQKILGFLIGLAQKNGLLVSSSSDGSLVLAKSVEAGNAVGKLEQGKSPLVSVTPNFQPQEYYSTVTGVPPMYFGISGKPFTARNDRLAGVVRPFTFWAEDMADADIPTQVQAKAARMFANVATYTVQAATWLDPQGNLWEPNTTVKLQAPDAMVYEPFEFLIRSVAFNIDRSSQTATLELTFPESFRGEIPERMPWES